MKNKLKIKSEDTKKGRKVIFSFTVDPDFAKKFDKYLAYQSRINGVDIHKSGLIRRIFMKFFDDNPEEIDLAANEEIKKEEDIF